MNEEQKGVLIYGAAVLLSIWVYTFSQLAGYMLLLGFNLVKWIYLFKKEFGIKS